MINPPPINAEVADQTKQFSWSWKQWLGALYSSVVPIQNFGVHSSVAPSSGFNIQYPANTSILQLTPASTLASGAVTFPANPVDAQRIILSTTQTITALTLLASSPINNPALSLGAGQSISYYYSKADNAWFSIVANTSSSSGTGAAGGSTSQVQVNTLGVLAGYPTLTFVSATGTLSTPNLISGGGTIDNTPLGTTVPSSGSFTSLDATTVNLANDAHLNLTLQSMSRRPPPSAPTQDDSALALATRAFTPHVPLRHVPPPDDTQIILANRIFRK
jgi:hypothetical protein